MYKKILNNRENAWVEVKETCVIQKHKKLKQTIPNRVQANQEVIKKVKHVIFAQY